MPQVHSTIYDLLPSIITEWEHGKQNRTWISNKEAEALLSSYRKPWLNPWLGLSPVLMPGRRHRLASNFTLMGCAEGGCSEAPSWQLQPCRDRQLYLHRQKESISCQEQARGSKSSCLSMAIHTTYLWNKLRRTSDNFWMHQKNFLNPIGLINFHFILNNSTRLFIYGLAYLLVLLVLCLPVILFV